MSGHTPLQGRLFILSAPSGAGKTTLCRSLLNHFSELHYAVSHTTRPPRPGEIHGTDYYFVTPAEFEQMIAGNLMAEWARVHDHYYGTSAQTLEQVRSVGRDILLDIDPQGARQLLTRYPDSVTIFIRPPSFAVLEERLRNRGANSAADMARRLENARDEMAQAPRYRHVIVNDYLPTATAELIALINGYRQERLQI